MEKLKRIISALLSLIMVMGTITFPSPTFAESNSKEFVEAEYKLEDIDGKSYKVYEFTDLTGKSISKNETNIDGLELSKPITMNAVRSSNPELGEEIPNAERYSVDIQWTTYDLKPEDIGTPVHFILWDKTTKTAIAQTEDVTQAGLADSKKDTPKGPTYKYKFKKLPGWDKEGVSHDTDNWQMRAPNEYRFDIRLKTGTSGNFSQENVSAEISQRGNPIYRAEYHTNKAIPTIEVQRTNVDDNTTTVPINNTNLTGNQYYSWAEAISSKQMPFFEGKLMDIQVYGYDSLESLQVSEPITAGRVKMAMKAPGKTEFDRGPGTFEDNGTPYHYEVTGDYKTLHIFTIRQDLKIKFDPNGGTWKGTAPADQTIGHSMKLADEWAGLGPITVPGAGDLTPPEVEAGKPEKEFIGWNTDADATTALFTDNTYAKPITDDVTTFYAIYKEKAQGKIKVEYQDMKGNTIDDKYKLAEKDYPKELPGNIGDAIKAEHLNGAPEFLGYEYKANATKPVPSPGETAGYTENGKYTLIYKYNKLDSVIPEKDPNGGADKTKPNGYVTVTFKAGEHGKINGGTTDVKFFVNPKDDVKFGDSKISEPNVTADAGYKVGNPKWNPDFDTKKSETIKADANFTAKYAEKDKVVKLDDPENPTNFPKDPTDDSKKDADYVTVKFVADENGKIKEGNAEKTKGIAYAVLKNTEWADAVTAGVVVPKADAKDNAPKLVGKDKFYSFKEWQKDGTKVTDFAKVDDNVTYTAVFGKADELTVNYNLNAPEGLTVGGTAPTDTNKYLNDEEVTVKALAADNTLAGYKFTGWNTQADGKGTAYAAGAKFAIKADTELFAQWEKTAKDVIPVDNENDEKGKNGEEIPTNYVFVEFKVKDEDADKANIKANQQAKFKVDPKAKVTLTAPELEVKDSFKVSHTAKFNKDDYTNKKFEKATTIWASVSEKGKIEVKYVFETNPNTKALPDALMALKPENLDGDNAVYVEPKAPTAPDTSSKEVQKALVERDAKDKKLGEWKAGNWKKDVDKNTGNITYTLTWTFEEVGKSKTPDVNPVKPGDKKITGKGEPGSDIEVKIPDKDDPIKTTVDQNGDWTVDVPEDKKLKDGDKVIVTQTEKDKKTSDPVEKTVTEDKKPEPKPEPVPEVEIPGIKYKDYYTPTYPVYVSVPDKKEPVQDIFTHEQYIFGYPDDTIRPDGDMTRAEAIAVVARLQKLDLSDKTSNIYKDTKAGMWYNAAINAAFREGYLLEKEGENIRPNDKITRAELALLISHIDKKNDKVAPFEDVKGHKFEAAINQAYGNERIKGYPDGTFKPDNSITRAEVATMLNKLYDRYPDKNFIDANQNLVHNYKDMSYKGHWGYYELVEAYHTHKFARLANNMEEWKAIIK